MKIDLASYSKADLEKLRADVDKQLASLDQRRKADARKAADEAARKYGFSLDDLLGKAKAPKGNPPKYANPADPRQTWSGRGRQPGWIKDGLAKGRSLSDFAI